MNEHIRIRNIRTGQRAVVRISQPTRVLILLDTGERQWVERADFNALWKLNNVSSFHPERIVS
jgi:hypothetical protein